VSAQEIDWTWLVVREGIGGVGEVSRKGDGLGDGWRIRAYGGIWGGRRRMYVGGAKFYSNIVITTHFFSRPYLTFYRSRCSVSPCFLEFHLQGSLYIYWDNIVFLQ
jgi:hypothetical protein